MGTEVKLLGRIRKLFESFDAEASGSDLRDLTLNQQLELLISQGSAPYQEIVRAGRAFWVNTAVAVPAVVAIPTTAHMLAIYNTEPDGGRSLIIDWVAAQNVASTAAAGQANVLGLLGQVRETVPVDAALPIKKCNGMGGGIPDAPVRTILTATALPAGTGLQTNWFPVGPSVGKPGAAATPGYGIWGAIQGGMIVPPGRYFAMHVIANVVGETFQGFIGFHVKQLQLG